MHVLRKFQRNINSPFLHPISQRNQSGYRFTLTTENTEGIFPKNIDHWYAIWLFQKDDDTGVEQLVVRIQDDFISQYVGKTLILNRVSE